MPSSLFKLAQKKCISLYVMSCVSWLGFKYSVKQFFNDRLFYVSLSSVGKERLSSNINDWRAKSPLLKNTNDAQKRVAVVTGGNGTIGSGIVEVLRSLNFVVLSIGRTKPKYFVDDDEFFKCDLRNFDEISETADKIKQRFDQIDLFVNTAGVMLYPEHSANAPDPHMQINLLSPLFLFNQIRELLEKSEDPRAVFISSATAHAGGIQLFLEDHLKEDWSDGISGYKAYTDSKLLLSLYLQNLGKKLEGEMDSKIRVGSCHPGVVPSKIYRYMIPPFRFMLNVLSAPFLRDGKRAARDVLSLAFDKNLENGGYYEFGYRQQFYRWSFGLPFLSLINIPYTKKQIQTLAEGIDKMIANQQ